MISAAHCTNEDHLFAKLDRFLHVVDMAERRRRGFSDVEGMELYKRVLKEFDIKVPQKLEER